MWNHAVRDRARSVSVKRSVFCGFPMMWRPMSARDLDAVVALADAIHLDHPERPEVFAERLRLFPSGCRVAVAAGGEAVGYAVAHPGRLGKPPALDSLLEALPPAPDCLYVHDVALLPLARGCGLLARLLPQLLAVAQAQGLSRLALVAVNGSEPIWRRLGFVPSESAVQSKLASYGGVASYMIRDATAV